MTPTLEQLDEGSTCPSCGLEKLHFKDVENCYCLISEPCGACINAPLVCPDCNEEFEVA